MPIKYVLGDATKPQGKGQKLIIHICNDKSGWGSGFVVSLSKRWKKPEQYYREWFKRRNPASSTIPGQDLQLKLGLLAFSSPFALGEAQFVDVENNDIWVANMIAQHGYMSPGQEPPVKLDALRKCLQEVKKWCDSWSDPPSLHAPRIGCGLGGRTWSEIEPLLEEILGAFDITIYDFEPQTKSVIDDSAKLF